MKKRLFATLLACAMTVSLVACGGSSSSSEKKEDTSDSKKQEASIKGSLTDQTLGVAGIDYSCDRTSISSSSTAGT